MEGESSLTAAFFFKYVYKDMLKSYKKRGVKECSIKNQEDKMSNILKIVIIGELENCTNIWEVEAVKKKYENSMKDNLEFNRLLREYIKMNS